jgi:primosomal protein N' (replication factor Y)
MSEQNAPFADLILPLAVPQYYTYRIPDSLPEQILPGCRVSVVLGKRRLYTAIVRRIYSNYPGDMKLSDILDVLDLIPMVSEMQMQFWEWIADYYMCTVGEVYRAAVPAGLKLESETCIFPGKPEAEPERLTNQEYNILAILENTPGITIGKLAADLKLKSVLPAIRKLVDKRIVMLEENFRKAYKPLVKDYIVLAKKYQSDEMLHELLDLLEKKAPKQASLINGLLQLTGIQKEERHAVIAKEQLMNSTGTSYAVLTALVKKEILEMIPVEVSRLTETEKASRPPHPLNPNQKLAFSAIVNEFGTKEVVLLHGVTSSGKTEIYIHLIAEQLRLGKQVLYLLPEIALTTQIIQRLRLVFGDRVGVYHSKFSDAERVEVYQSLLGIRKENSPSYQIILGVRSSLFLPFTNLGLVIVDEEHENTYKQFDPAPRYNARDASVVLAGMHKAKVLMGTATPSFESYLNALNGRYGLVELRDRYQDIQLPEIQVVDIREARRRKLMNSHFSPYLTDAVGNALARHEQVILFQNRRGFSPYIECFDCSWVPYCRHCDVSLTYHRKSNRLHCHYCGYSIINPANCASCGGNKLVTRGFGTEKVEDEIALIFPDARLARMDLDTTRTRKAYEKIIGDFELQKVDILIGTQMVSKGLDFDHVRVVGILDADSMLNFPDFRSFERSFQLIAQVSGRAGRKKERGIVIVQTSVPENTVISHVIHNDYKSFFHAQAKERRQFKYPPYYRLVKLTLRHKDLDTVNKAAAILAAELRKKLGDRVVGPEFPLINRLFNLHQKCILVKIERDKHFSERRSAMRGVIDKLKILAEFRRLQIIPDVDPYN